MMNADGGDRFALCGAFGDGVADDMLVFVDDAIGGAFDAGESSVRFKRVPENSLENIACGCLGEFRAVIVNGFGRAVYIAFSDVFSSRF